MGLFDILNPFDFDSKLDFLEDVATFDVEDQIVMLAQTEVLPFTGITHGDIATAIDGVLDKYPWLKTAIIVAAGAATGGAGAFVAAGAMAATDAMAKASDGDITGDEWKAFAFESAALTATAATAGGGALATTSAQVQFAGQIVDQFVDLGKFGAYARLAAGAAAMDWSSLQGAVQNVSRVMQAVADTEGEAGVSRLMAALSTAAGGDLSSLGDYLGAGNETLAALGVYGDGTRRAIAGAIGAAEGGSAGAIAAAAAGIGVEVGLVGEGAGRIAVYGAGLAGGGFGAEEIAALANAIGAEAGLYGDDVARVIGGGLSAAADGIGTSEAGDLAAALVQAVAKDETAAAGLKAVGDLLSSGLSPGAALDAAAGAGLLGPDLAAPLEALLATAASTPGRSRAADSEALRQMWLGTEARPGPDAAPDAASGRQGTTP
ncbi:MAG: hypothetical protein MUE98_01035 [Rhodobacteraceae bacterium]|jgi:hypothetical protein|nr:hypothetical protein [Paracoccaceae bacterium]